MISHPRGWDLTFHPIHEHLEGTPSGRAAPVQRGTLVCPQPPALLVMGPAAPRVRGGGLPAQPTGTNHTWCVYIVKLILIVFI